MNVTRKDAIRTAKPILKLNLNNVLNEIQIKDSKNKL